MLGTGLWWAGSGLIEALQEAKVSAQDAEWAPTAKALANKVDFYIRDLAAGVHRGSDALMREVLYTIGKSRLEPARVRGIRRL